jgi:putative spermidine/putrescine transport system permease protein
MSNSIAIQELFAARVGGAANVERVPRLYMVFLLLPCVVLAVLYAYPLATILWISVTVPEPGLGHFIKIWESEAIHRILWTTFRISALTTAIAVAVGYVIAYAVLHARGTVARWMLFIVLLSFWLSVLIRAFAWLTLLQRTGLVNTTLMDLGLIEQPLALVRNELGVVIGMVHFMIPFAVLPLLANMRGIDPVLSAAARGLGASRVQTFVTVFLPLSAPGLFGAVVIVFIFALGFYITPALLGGGRTIMIAEYINLQVVETLNWGLGAALATVLLASITVLMLIMARFVDMRSMFGAK